MRCGCDGLSRQAWSARTDGLGLLAEHAAGHQQVQCRHGLVAAGPNAALPGLLLEPFRIEQFEPGRQPSLIAPELAPPHAYGRGQDLRHPRER